MHRLFPNERIILKKLREGDKKAYQYLFETYYKLLYFYAKSLTKNKTGSKDIVQNVFLKVWLNRENIHIKTSLKNYLYRSVYNVFIDEHKMRPRKVGLLQEIHGEILQKSIIEEEDRILERMQWINKEIELLPPKAKEIFTMNKRRGLSYKEIAKMLDISEKTVESHIGRVLKRLRIRAKEMDFLLFFFL